ncbi:MAG TPA: RNA polymerase sigma factor [Bacteroidetes bacterium]|nr:RNA polymerase sigma factor [Bacteroidota bacterium]
METSDSELLALLRESRDNHHRVFQLLVKKYHQKIYWHIRQIVIDHEDANDVTQNAFIKAWENLSGFRGESSLYTWLYRIATNEALGFLKRKNKRHLFSIDHHEQLLAGQIEHDPLFDGDEIQRRLQQAMLSLPTKQRLVFQMKYMQEMKYEDISHILNTSVGALKASYYHAVKKIEQFLEKY